jgi:pimeloyl-ACP methyl ester carboxylesterase
MGDLLARIEKVICQLYLAFCLLAMALIWVSGCVQQRAQPSQVDPATLTILIPAKPSAGFQYPYLLRVQPKIDEAAPMYLLVEPNNSGKPCKRFEYHLAKARELAETGVPSDVSRRLGVPLFVPVFPRPPEIYTQFLNRRALLATAPELHRLDLQLLAMIADARCRLARRDIQIQEKILLTGFSASGAFANRFTALHPEVVKAVAAGGVNGMFILPMDRIGTASLPFPLGTADFASILNRPFQVDAWRRVSQFIYMGADDTNDAVKFDDAYTETQRKIIYEYLGERMQPDRWEKCQSLYREAGATVTFRTYPCVGHDTNERIHADIADFFRQASQPIAE